MYKVENHFKLVGKEGCKFCSRIKKEYPEVMLVPKGSTFAVDDVCPVPALFFKDGSCAYGTDAIEKVLSKQYKRG